MGSMNLLQKFFGLFFRRPTLSSYAKDIMRLNRGLYDKIKSGTYELQIGGDIVATGQEAIDRLKQSRVGTLYVPHGEVRLWGKDSDQNERTLATRYPWDIQKGNRWHIVQTVITFVPESEGGVGFGTHQRGSQLSIYPDYPGMDSCTIIKIGTPFTLKQLE